MNSISFGEWVAVISVLVALVIGVIQIAKSGSGSNGVSVNQKAGFFSKSKQKVNIKVNKNDG